MKMQNVAKRCAQKCMQTVSDVAFRAAEKSRKHVPTVGTALVLGGASGLASAQSQFTIDPAPIVSTITSGVTVVSAIGMAVLSLVVVIKLFVWVRRTL